MSISIVMYHFVRNLSGSRFPKINALELKQFKEQLAYLVKYYQMVTVPDLFAAYFGKKELPKNSALLTFDDGYKDHYEWVFPLLDKAGIQGAFFAPACAVLESKVLDVNKIHFINACADPLKVIAMINDAIKEQAHVFGLRDLDFYWQKHGVPNRFDGPEVNYIKRMLQVELPYKLRHLLVDQIFKKFVTSDEFGFANELYLNMDEIREMQGAGMYFGSHGYAHNWMNSLGKKDLLDEVDLSIQFLRRLKVNEEHWTICYPYGGYSDEVIKVLKEKSFKIGFTTHVGIANLSTNPMLLPRLDTNDLPKNRFAPPNEWTQKVIS